MRIFVKTLTSDKYIFDGEAITSIPDVKRLISPALDAHPQYVRLVFEGTELKNSCTLGECNVSEGALLLVLPRRQMRVLTSIFDRIDAAVKELQQAVRAQEEIDNILDDYCFAHVPIKLQIWPVSNPCSTDVSSA